jgi:site-specific DNA-methyltransferase (adenine-specific)
MIDKWVGNIYIGDALHLISLLPDQSIDISIESPPYNVDLGNNKYNKTPYDLYNDNMEHKEYIKWLKEIFGLLKQKMVIGGRVCINIGDQKNGMIPTHSDIIQFMTNELGYLLKSTIIWNKNQTSNRAAWGSFCSPSNPSFPSTFEYILIFCNGDYQKIGNKENITVTKEEFINNSLGLWEIKPETRLKELGHPAMFPIELPYRLIQQLSYKNDVVLDVFSGLGTTCLAAEMLKRRWIGFEISSIYADKSIQRINTWRQSNGCD